MANIELFDSQGRRKYLSQQERIAFLEASRKFEGHITTFCYVLVYTGCRISEALNLKGKHIDLVAGALTFETLKKRKKGSFRQIPIPPELIESLRLVHNPEKNQNKYLWTNRKGEQLTRMTVFKWVKKVYTETAIKEPVNQPKALRHGFAKGHTT